MSVAATPPFAPPAELELFGELVMTIAGRRVVWLRRRDRQIVAYLALQPEGRASRSDLIAAFWPHAEAGLGTQSLRTACSTIRRAIGRCAGDPDAYFRGGAEVQLTLDRFGHRLHAFETHLAQAEAALGNDDAVSARAHFLFALRMHRAPLLEAEGDAAWLRERRARCAAAAERAERLAEELRPRPRASMLGDVRLLVPA